MCGIAGIVDSRLDRTVDELLIREMCRAIHHRGPDDGGLWCEGGVGIGMTRLSIIDVAGGHQPIFNEDGSVAVVFNGEIYNHDDIRRDLEDRGHRFRTRVDSETIVHLYEEYDRDCVDHLRGMFAFAVWDSRKRKLFIARDRLGIKPLHYTSNNGRLIFSSEIKSILSVPGVARAASADALVAYMAYGYVPAPLTMFEGISKLPAGHWLEFADGEVAVEPYWDVEYRPDHSRSEEETVDGVLEILDEAVRMRLMSEVPLGAFLSGGTDSSVVVGLMARHMTSPVKTFSIGFDFDRYSELGYARKVAEHFKTEHHEHIVTPDVLGLVGRLIDQFDEPFSDSSAIPTYYVSELARERVTVALSGDGGDELFAGYSRFFDDSHVRMATRVPVALRKALLEPLTRAFPADARGIDYMRDAVGTRDEQYVRRITGGVSSIYRQVFSGRTVAAVESTDPLRFVRPYLDHMAAGNVLSRRQYVDTKMYLCDDILTKVDRTSMLVSLEARVPILDHKVVEFAATIPAAMHTRGSGMKHVLKKAAERLMPSAMVNRPKMGFGIPLGEWIQTDWAELADDLVLGPRSSERGNLNPEFVQRVMAEHRRGRRDNGTMIWRLMVLELWYRSKLEGETLALA